MQSDNAADAIATALGSLGSLRPDDQVRLPEAIRIACSEIVPKRGSRKPHIAHLMRCGYALALLDEWRERGSHLRSLSDRKDAEGRQ